MIRALAIALCLSAACTDVEQGVDFVAAPVGAGIGHYYDCQLEVQLGYPTPVSVQAFTYRPCLAPGAAARDAYIAAWVHDVCQPIVDEAYAAGDSPGGGDCGGSGCDPQNLDLCFYDSGD